MNKFINDRPWLWIILAFIVMIGSLAVVISIAVKNEPKSVPLQHEAADGP